MMMLFNSSSGSLWHMYLLAPTAGSLAICRSTDSTEWTGRELNQSNPPRFVLSPRTKFIPCHQPQFVVVWNVYLLSHWFAQLTDSIPDLISSKLIPGWGSTLTLCCLNLFTYPLVFGISITAVSLQFPYTFWLSTLSITDKNHCHFGWSARTPLSL